MVILEEREAISDFDQCSQEPVHNIGQIQPHGLLFALSEPDLIVRQVSTNVSALLGISPDILLGQSFESVVGAEHFLMFQSQVKNGDTLIANPLPLRVGGKALKMTLVAHRQDGVLIVEMELVEGSYSIEPLNLDAIRLPLSRMQQASDIPELSQLAASEIQRLSGFDRVMVYRFDEEWSGEVIAEAAQPSPVSYLGLHFPASDIPSQVRRLFLLNPLRTIVDIDAIPVPIVPAIGPLTGRALDLTCSFLRSPSPVHLEYLRNMGVQSSMTVSIIVGHQLWGMIACHHAAPRHVDRLTRSICELIGQTLGSRMALRMDNTALQLRVASRNRLHNYMADLDSSASLVYKDHFHCDQLLELFGADGMVLRIDGILSFHGHTAEEKEMLPIVNKLRELSSRGIASSNRLSALDASAECYASQVSGALYVELRKETGDYLLLLRRELVKTVVWAGKPEKSVITNGNGRLHPRASFEAWQETVRGRCLPWGELELESARFLREQLLRLGEAQSLRQAKDEAAENILHSREQELREAQRIARMGSWWWDPKFDSVIWSAELSHITCRDPTLPPPAYQEHLAFYTPGSSSRLDAAIHAAIQTGVPYYLDDLEMVRADGAIRIVTGRGEVERDSGGHAVLVRGTVHDVTERKQDENEIRLLARLNAVVAEIGQNALRSDHSGKVLDDSAILVAQTLDVEYCKVLELLPGGEALLLRSGIGWKEGLVGHQTIAAGKDSQAGYTILSEQPVIVEDLRTETRFRGSPLLHDHRVVSGMSVIISTSEGPYGVLAVHTRTRRPFSADEVNFLEAVSNVLGMMIERERTEQALQKSADEVLDLYNNAPCGYHSVDKDGVFVRVNDTELSWLGYTREETIGKLKFTDLVTSESLRSFQENFPKLKAQGAVRDLDFDMVRKDGTILPVLLNATAITDSAGVYLTSRATVYDITARKRTESEIRILNTQLEQRVAARTRDLQTANQLKDDLIVHERAISAELERAREREVEVGFRIQQNLLLDQPPQDIPGLRVAAMTVPSQRIDGDFYIFLSHTNQCLDVIVGDVMGKGINAALLGAATKSSFLKALSHLMALSMGGELPEPKDIVMLAHSEIVRHLIDLDSFVTLCYVRLDVNRQNLEMVDCGHTGLIYWHSRNGLCEVLHGDNLPLGVREGEIYQQVSVNFEAGDLLLFFSDGITEARNPAGEFFGAEKLVEYVRTHAELEPAILVEAIRKAVFEFSGSPHLNDDLTSVAIRVEEKRVRQAWTEIEIRSDLKELRQVRKFVRNFCHNLPEPVLDEDRVAALELAANEAASNIMKHAYQGRKDKWIHLEGEAFPGYITIRLHDSGDTFDPSLVPVPVLDGSHESGYGAYIISHSVDQVRYFRDERGRNCIALVTTRNARNQH